jgi:hypothetical protein
MSRFRSSTNAFVLLYSFDSLFSAPASVSEKSISIVMRVGEKAQLSRMYLLTSHYKRDAKDVKMSIHQLYDSDTHVVNPCKVDFHNRNLLSQEFQIFLRVA